LRVYIGALLPVNYSNSPLAPRQTMPSPSTLTGNEPIPVFFRDAEIARFADIDVMCWQW
jgi:hypothetical protein